jgi:CheY-like chemotaxis protein
VEIIRKRVQRIKEPLNIFVVGNDPLYRKMMDQVFVKDFTYRFFGFSSANDCLRLLHLGPRLLIVDFSMPECNEMLVRVREEFKDACILMLLKSEKERGQAESLRAHEYHLGENGFDSLLTKTKNLLKKLSTGRKHTA